MAKAYIKIKCERGVIRTFGGNTSDVRAKKRSYENMSKESFLERHKYLTEDDYNTLTVSKVYKNR